MYTTAIRHSVSDYGQWKNVYDTFTPTSAGAKFARVNRSVEDRNLVTVVAGFDTLDLAKAFLANPNLKTKMTEGGVLGSPRIEINEEIESI